MNADRIRVWLLVTIMGLIMLGSFWVYEVMRRNAELAASSNQVRSAPDYFVEQFNFVRLSQSGKTNYRVTGDRLTHFPKEDEFEIIHPLIVSVDQEQTPMKIRADRAIIKQKVKEEGQAAAEDQIHMLGNVELERSRADQANYLAIKSTSLILFPDSEKMKTEAEVQLNTPRANMRAVGMLADNIEQKIRLLSRVKLEIEPPSANKPIQRSSSSK